MNMPMAVVALVGRLVVIFSLLMAVPLASMLIPVMRPMQSVPVAASVVLAIWPSAIPARGMVCNDISVRA